MCVFLKDVLKHFEGFVCLFESGLQNQGVVSEVGLVSWADRPRAYQKTEHKCATCLVPDLHLKAGHAIIILPRPHRLTVTNMDSENCSWKTMFLYNAVA